MTVDPLIIQIMLNMFLVFITGFYVFLTYKILKSNEKIAKLNLDPMLWVNLLASGGVYIEKMKKYPAYNIIMEFSIQTPRTSKNFVPLAIYFLGDIIEKEKIFDVNFEEQIEEYIKKRKKKEIGFILKCVIKYNLGIDKSFIKRTEYLYGHSEEVEDGEIFLGFSYDKNPSLTSMGNAPKRIIYFKH